MHYAKLRFSVPYTGNLAAGQVVGGNMGGTGSCMILRILLTGARKQGSCIPISCLTHQPGLVMLYSTIPPGDSLHVWGLPHPKVFKNRMSSSRILTQCHKHPRLIPSHSSEQSVRSC